MAITSDNRIIAEKSQFITKAGSTRENYFLVGLRFKLTVRIFGIVRSVYLYSSDIPENETNRFDMTSEGGGVYSHEGIAGEDATAIALATDTGASFTVGIKFYFRIKIKGENGDKVIEHIFWVRDPDDILLFTDALIPYISPYPVLVGDLVVPISIAPFAKDESGSVLRGGIATVEVFDTEGIAPGCHVTTQPEIAAENLAEITLIDRNNASGVPDFIPPPGAPDFSRYYHFVTFRLRAKIGSVVYRDIPVILFAAGNCAIESIEVYGYGSGGTGTVSPPEEPEEESLLPPLDELPPTETCNAYTEITTDVTVNQYSQKTEVLIYDAAIGGNLLASGEATVTGKNTIKITRSSLGGDMSLPVSGFLEVKEYGPDRTSSNRLEGVVQQCQFPNDGYEITTIIYNPATGKVEITTTGGSDVFDEETTYLVRKYDSEYNGTLETTYTAEYTSNHVISFETLSDITGWFAVVADESEITAPLEYSEITIAATDHFWRWNIASGTWSEVTASNSPCNRQQHSMFVLGGEIYVRGGLDADNNLLADIWKYNLGTNTWTQLPTPTIIDAARYGHTEQVLDSGNSTMLIRGTKGEPITDPLNAVVACYQFTPPNSYVGKGEPAHYVRGGSCDVFYDGDELIWYPLSNYGPGIGYYSFSAGMWDSLGFPGYAPTPVDFTAFANNGTGILPIQCWVFGGRRMSDGVVLDQVFYYDINPLGSSVVQSANAPVSCEKWAAAFMTSTNKFLLFGGQINGVTIARTWTVNAATGAWSEKTPSNAPSARHGHRMVELGGYIYMFGGMET